MENLIGNKPQGPQVTLENTTPMFNDSEGVLWKEGVILRRVSKFLIGADEDGIIPIPVFYDPETLKILETSIPPALKEELKDYLANA